MNYFCLLFVLLSHGIYAVPSLPTSTTYDQSPVPQDRTLRPPEIPYLDLSRPYLTPREFTNFGIDNLTDWLNNKVTPTYKGPCPLNSTQNPRICNGETCFRQRLGLFNLPYGVFGVVSHIFHFYTFACLGFGRSPWKPRKRLDGGKFDVVLSVMTIVVTTTAVVISFWNPRFTSLDPFCRNHGKYWWAYLLILTKAYLGLASGIWSYEMNNIAHKKNLDISNQSENEDSVGNPQSIVDDVPEVEFGGGLAKAGWFSGRGGWKTAGIVFILTLMVGMAGLGLEMWTHQMTELSIVCTVLILLVMGYSQYLSKQANEKKLTRIETFLRKMSWSISLVLIFSWADLVLGLAARNPSGRPEQGIYTFALYFVGKELPFLSA